MSRKKLVVLFVGLISAVVIVGALLWANTKGQVPFTKGMQTNGYDNFFRAATYLVSDGQTVSPDDYDAFLRTNRQALAILREGLKLKAELPAEYYEQRNLAIDKLGTFKGLANAMKVEAQQAELHGKYGDAANSYLDIIRFGQKVEAGVHIHFLVGLALEQMGLRGMEALEPNLSGGERGRVAAELQALAASRISFDDVLDRERYFMRRNSMTPLHYFVGVYMTKAAIPKARGKHQNHGKELLRVAAKFEENK